MRICLADYYFSAFQDFLYPKMATILEEPKRDRASNLFVTNDFVLETYHFSQVCTNWTFGISVLISIPAKNFNRPVLYACKMQCLESVSGEHGSI